MTWAEMTEIVGRARSIDEDDEQAFVLSDGGLPRAGGGRKVTIEHDDFVLRYMALFVPACHRDQTGRNVWGKA